MFEEIGTVQNFADPDSLQHLALFRDSASKIQLRQDEDSSAYFSPEYSHYIVVHTPLDAEHSERGKEWTSRFCGGLGVSIVERIEAGDGAIRVKGLMAASGSKIYAVLPYTHIDRTASEDSTFLSRGPSPREVGYGQRFFRRSGAEISSMSGAVLGGWPWMSQGKTRPLRYSGSTSTTPRRDRRG